MKFITPISTSLGQHFRSVVAMLVTVLLGAVSASAAGVSNKAVYTPAVQILQGSLPFSQSYTLSIVSPGNYPVGTASTVTYTIAVNAKPGAVSDATALSYLKLSSPSLSFSGPLETKTVDVTLTVPAGAVAGAYGFRNNRGGLAHRYRVRQRWRVGKCNDDRRLSCGSAVCGDRNSG